MTVLDLVTATAVLFLTISAMRIPSLRRWGRAAPSWLATSFGGLGLLCVVALVPIDAWLGGTNVANMLQDEFAILSFWFFRNAVLEYTGAAARKWSPWLLIVMLLAAGLPFFFIQHRGGTNPHFGVDHIAQVATLAFEDLYFLCLVTICASMLISLFRIRSTPIRVITGGLALLFLGSIADATFMTLRHFGVPQLDLLAPFYLFYGLFYPGAMLAAVGLTWLIVIERRYISKATWRIRVFWLRRVQSRLLAQTRGSRNRVIHLDRLDAQPPQLAYQLVIAVHNLQAKEGLSISPREQLMIDRVERYFENELPAGLFSATSADA